MVAFFLGIITNNLEFSLALGIVFELFWLDALRLGAIIPPSGNLSFLLLYPMALIFNWQHPSQFAIPLLICLSLAYTTIKIELFQRKQANNYICCVEKWTANPQTGMHPSQIIYKSLTKFILIYSALYIVLFFILYLLFDIISLKFNLHIENFSWTILYAASLMGAILALRTKRAYAILLLALILIFLAN